MSRLGLLTLLCLLTLMALVQLSHASVMFRLNESATQFLFSDQPIISLEINSPAPQSVGAHVKLELLDPADSVRGRSETNQSLAPGMNKLQLPLRLVGTGLTDDDYTSLPWYRIRYWISAVAEEKAAPE